ncbi:MAG TPA: DNA alkylation repair protein [Bacteroidales bacterium]|nr:DNA alkylation repair protein [Bacteroidales bacterium]HPT02904.1 DNA alkylation repair protein [Bacteroidales bacterium]
MTPTALFNDIRFYCTANASDEMVMKYSRYFREGYDAYGLSLDQLEEKVLDILEHEETTFDLILKTSRLLVKSPKYEETSFAILLTKAFAKHFTPDIFNEIEKWFENGITNWAHADVISGELLIIFLKKKLVSLQAFENWRTADNKFQRRAVPVTLIKLLKTTEDFTPLFSFIEPLMMDTEREVQQGLGWFLREAWKLQPEAAEIFLTKWKDSAPRLIFQYATEKMTAEQKKRFKKGS